MPKLDFYRGASTIFSGTISYYDRKVWLGSCDKLIDCMKVNPSRREVLLGSSALFLTGLCFDANQLYAAAILQEPQNVQLGFAGDNILQLLVEETDIAHIARVSVTNSDNIVWRPNSNDRFGGLGSLNGVSGNFSGKRNTTTPQLFEPWPKFDRESILPAFQAGLKSVEYNAFCDRPSTWSIWINGQSVEIIEIYRKTVPIKSARISRFDDVHRKRHLLSFELASPIADGDEITIKGPLPDIVYGTRKTSTVSEAIHVCQVGFALNGPKKGYVGLWLGHNVTGQASNTDAVLSQNVIWRLIDVSLDKVVADGVLKMAMAGEAKHMEELNFNGCAIYEADFSEVTEPATFRLEIEGVGASVPFQITENPYAPVLRDAARWYFHQRSGCPIEEPFGEGRRRPRNGHPDDGLTVWQTDVKLGRTSEGFLGGPNASLLLAEQPISANTPSNQNAWGGWHDAGDWDRRIQHMDAVFQMANIIELFPSSRSLHLNIPESGKTFADQAIQARKSETDTGDHTTILPDLVHEALWGISLWRRTQGVGGGIIGGVEYSLDGIYGSVSWNPVQETYAYAEEEWAAYLFALAAAKLGHVIKTICGDAVLGNALISEAELAWTWAESEIQSESELKKEGFDDQGFFWMESARVASAASLYRANGNRNARQLFEENNPFHAMSDEPHVRLRPNVYSHASLDYVSAWHEGRDCNPEIVSEILRWSRLKISNEKRMGADYGLHNTNQYPWGRGWLRFGPGSNWRASELALEFLVNGRNSTPLRNVLIEGMWFGLGCNPSNTSFIQGFGSRSFSDPLTMDLVGQDVVPGQISFGVAGGALHPWEKSRTEGAIFPSEQDDWPRYAQIFESSMIAVCSEHGIKSNAMEWLFASAFVCEALMDHQNSAPTSN